MYYELTALDLKALKTADRIEFWYFAPNSEGSGDELSYVEAIKATSSSDDSPWSGGGELTRRIVANSYIYCHGHWRYESRPTMKRGFWSSAAYFVLMKTWINLLKVGDVIRLDWEASDQAFGANLWTEDRLSLTILRNGKEQYSFMIRTDITAKDGWGRMCVTEYPALAV